VGHPLAVKQVTTSPIDYVTSARPRPSEQASVTRATRQYRRVDLLRLIDLGFHADLPTISSMKDSAQRAMVPPCHEAAPRTSGDVRVTPFDRAPLDQVPEHEQADAQAHAGQLATTIATGNKSQVRTWLSHRIAEADALCQRYQALREVLLAPGTVSRSILRNARDLDSLANSQHRRMLDFLEVLRRLDQRDVKPVVQIRSAESVAVVAGDAVGLDCGERT
jgi:hypothetical protein